ncbi:MAG: DUF751 family protein [Leptolyngbyaceae cyanobacterium bins.59]|nr:DUF751 family protein [Leptolyngbyaceae cyanobacterium bins.59]
MEGFWANVSRYPRYFITMLLGVVLNAFAPLLPMLKRPITAIPLVGVFLAAITFFALTLRAMLGLA